MRRLSADDGESRQLYHAGQINVGICVLFPTALSCTESLWSNDGATDRPISLPTKSIHVEDLVPLTYPLSSHVASK